MKTMIPPQVGMRLRTLQKKEKKRKRERPKRKKRRPKKKRKGKNERKREKGQCYYLFFHTCASKQHHDLHDRESPMSSLSYTKWEFFIIELGLYIPMMGFLKNALGLHEQASWMHTHLVSFVELSYIYSSSASAAWQSLLTHIDIY